MAKTGWPVGAYSALPPLATCESSATARPRLFYHRGCIHLHYLGDMSDPSDSSRPHDLAAVPGSAPEDRARPWPAITWLVAAAAVAGLSAWLRFDLLEPLTRTAQCAAAPDLFICQLRAVLIVLVQLERLGWIALAIVVIGLITGLRTIIAAGFLTGAAALMLYSVEPGAVAALLASIVLLRSKGSFWRASSG